MVTEKRISGLQTMIKKCDYNWSQIKRCRTFYYVSVLFFFKINKL